MPRSSNVSSIMDAEERAGLDRVARSLTEAWNAGDGVAFAQCFTTDADFVNIFGLHVVGREAVAKQHQFIFDSIYRGSRNAFAIVEARRLADAIILAHIAADLRVPDGPLAGEIRTLASAVFVRDGAGWLIASFHNTREQQPPGSQE
jgi:uncharacterized protein (TIGR02246 family)